MSLRRQPALKSCSFRIEKQHSGCSLIGLDEVGRGCIAGPVYVAGVCFSEEVWARRSKMMTAIKDSKLIKEEQREELYDYILETAEVVEWHHIEAEEIDRLNVLQATLKAFGALISKIHPTKKNLELLLVDGDQAIPGTDIPQRLIVDGDRYSKSIAAASIVAKVLRDRAMRAFAKIYPEYGFEQNKGYGTKSHWAALNEFGPTPLHRRSFLGKPLKNKIGREAEGRVVNFLAENGFEIIHRNWRCKIGEIDIIARKKNRIHFIEVRRRESPDLELAFPVTKQQQFRRVIEVFMQRPEVQSAEACHSHFFGVVGPDIQPEWDVFKL